MQIGLGLSMGIRIPLGGANKNYRLIAMRFGAPGGYSANNLSDGSVSSATYRQWHKTPVGYGCSILRMAFPNWYMPAVSFGSQELPGPNSITVKAAIEYNSVLYPVYFNGSRTVTIAAGDTAFTDELQIAIPAGAVFFTRIYVTNNGNASGKWPLGRRTGPGNPDSDNYLLGGEDVVDATGNFTTSSPSGYHYEPCAIYGVPTVAGQPSVLLMGDSIGTGSNDGLISGAPGWNQPPGLSGFLERALGVNFAWASYTRSTYRTQFIAAGHAGLKKGILPFVSSVIGQTDINDAFNGRTFNQIQADLLSIWNELTGLGKKVFWTTASPDTTSTDGWTSVANQTINAADDAVRTAINDWIRTSPAPLSGYFEVADAVESSRNSGKWAVSSRARTVTDAAISTSTPNTLTSATANFAVGDVGLGINLPGAGAGGAAYRGVIGSVTNSTTAKLVTNISTTVSGASLAIGALTNDGLHPVQGGYDLCVPAINTGLLS